MSNEHVLHTRETIVSHGGQWTIEQPVEWPFRFRGTAGLRVTARDVTTDEERDIDVTVGHIGTRAIVDDSVVDATPGVSICVSGTNLRRPAHTLRVRLEVLALDPSDDGDILPDS